MSRTFERVLLVRHGETEWNQVGRRQGQLDSPLTSQGIRQAEAIASHTSGINVDALFSSPLGRAHATAEVISEAVGHPVELVPDLSEVHHGEFAGLTSEEIEQRWPGALDERKADKFEWRFPGGESYRDAASRAACALDEIDNRASVRPLVVAHEMIGRMVIGQLLGLSPNDAVQQKLSHGTIVDINPKRRQTRVITLPL